MQSFNDCFLRAGLGEREAQREFPPAAPMLWVIAVTTKLPSPFLKHPQHCAVLTDFSEELPQCWLHFINTCLGWPEICIWKGSSYPQTQPGRFSFFTLAAEMEEPWSVLCSCADKLFNGRKGLITWTCLLT